jgi:hypothetical protein
MLYPISRGNLIQWYLKNGAVIKIFDHSYNNSFESLKLMMDQALTSSNNLVIFTPIRECKGTETIYKDINNFIENNKINAFIYDPNHEFPWTNPYLKKFNDKKVLFNEVIKLMDKDLSIFIKGANSLKMLTVVLDLLEYLGNN